jgi:signal transduction histidine kinase
MRGSSDQSDHLSVLLVEHDEALASAIEGAFSYHPLDWTLDTAISIEAAAGLIASRAPSIILASASMPSGDPAALAGDDEGSARFPVVLMHNARDDHDPNFGTTHAGIFDHIMQSQPALADIPHRTAQILRYWRLLGTQSDAEAELRENEQFNFALFQHNPSATVAVDQEGKVIKSNLARRAMSESLPELGARLFRSDGDDSEQQLASALSVCIDEGKTRGFSEIQLGENWYEITMAPLPHGAIVLSQNITKRKLAEVAAEEHQRQLIHADKMVSLGTLVSGVAHEVSNPNNAMLLSSSALKRMVDDVISVLDNVRTDTGDFDVGQRSYDEVRHDLPEMIGVIHRSAERIKNIVGDLKTYARRGTEVLTETVDLNELVDASVSLLSSLIKSSTNHFSVEKDETIPSVLGNAQQIEQVVINLITNACQALENRDSGITIRTRCDPGTSNVLVEVQDSGPGIDAELMDRITEPFFTTKHDDGGTGLGLSISRTIVENHHGELRFASEPGKGTLATIRLPQRGQDTRDREVTEGTDQS